MQISDFSRKSVVFSDLFIDCQNPGDLVVLLHTGDESDGVFLLIPFIKADFCKRNAGDFLINPSTVFSVSASIQLVLQIQNTCSGKKRPAIQIIFEELFCSAGRDPDHELCIQHLGAGKSIGEEIL